VSIIGLQFEYFVYCNLGYKNLTKICILCFRTPSRVSPKIDGKDIDLYLLYVLVTAQGGWVKVSLFNCVLMLFKSTVFEIRIQVLNERNSSRQVNNRGNMLRIRAKIVVLGPIILNFNCSFIKTKKFVLLI